jgi:hypothetical protein
MADVPLSRSRVAPSLTERHSCGARARPSLFFLWALGVNVNDILIPASQGAALSSHGLPVVILTIDRQVT